MGIAGHIVGATHAVVDVLAVGGLVSTARSGVTDRYTEGVATHEAVAHDNEEYSVSGKKRNALGPINDLLVGVVVTTIAWECVGVHQASKRVPTLVRENGRQL